MSSSLPELRRKTILKGSKPSQNDTSTFDTYVRGSGRALIWVGSSFISPASTSLRVCYMRVSEPGECRAQGATDTMKKCVETASVKRGMERQVASEHLARLRQEDEAMGRRMIQLTQRFRVRASTSRRKVLTINLRMPASHRGGCLQFTF